MRVHLEMLGCGLNEAEIETWSRGFRKFGDEWVSGAAGFLAKPQRPFYCTERSKSGVKINSSPRCGPTLIMLTGTLSCACR
jgi:hypothetical protein